MLNKISIQTLAWAALIGNSIVILQGAIVRATGSGAGCGRHWPTCNGEIVPLAASTETMIEFSHRLLSLVVLILGAWVLARVWQTRKEQRGLFVFGLLSFIFLIIEALLGAATVLFGLTGENTSVARGLMVASHLVNSLLLVGALTLTVVYGLSQGCPLAVTHFKTRHTYYRLTRWHCRNARSHVLRRHCCNG